MTNNNEKMHGSNIRVLVVEDSQILSQALEFGLIKAGFDVFVAHDGAEGIKKIKSVIPEMVLLDIMMPNINGVEVLKSVGRFKKKNGIKIFMLTNLSEEENIEECLSLGADDYLIKANFTIASIVEKIKKAIK